MCNRLLLVGAVASLVAFVVLDGGRDICPPRIAIGSALVVGGCR